MPLASIKPLFVLPCMLALLAGCTTPIEPAKQSVSVQTFEGNEQITGIRCELTNDRGQWTLVTPGSVQVIPSAEDLSIACARSNESGSGLAQAVSRPTAGYLSHPVVNLTMPVVAVVEPVKELTVGLTRVYPERVQVMMDQDIIVTATQ